MKPETRAFLMAVRQALIMILGALEEYLELERSITPRRMRGNGDGRTIPNQTYGT